MIFDRVPSVILVIIGVSLIGVTVAIANGQGIVSTIWGWWVLFQYPFVGLFAYLQPEWPKKFPIMLIYLLIMVLVIEVIVQVSQYLLGQPPGDNLAGLFGEHGTSNLIIFVLLLLSFALGLWLAKGSWKLLLIVIVLGSISSLLGETKLFPFAAAGMGGLSVLYVFVSGKRVWRLVPYSLLGLGVLGVFFLSYNAIIPAAQKTPLESFFNADTLDDYLGFVIQKSNVGQSSYYNVGRNVALSYAWQKVTLDRKTFIFGYGLGARGESQTLGTAGIGLLGEEFLITSGTSLLIMMQEIALYGMIAFIGILVWLIIRLYRGIREDPHSDLTVLRIGLLFFSLMWPVWLWYSTVWAFRVPMLIYWVVLGYVISHTDGNGEAITSRSLNNVHILNTGEVKNGS